MITCIKSDYVSFVNTYDDIQGDDLATFHYNELTFYGKFTESPIESRLISKYNYRPVLPGEEEPYRAHWMVFEARLFLGYVNGVFDHRRYYTNEIVPEFPDSGLLYPYREYCGTLCFLISKIEAPDNTDLDKYVCDVLRLKIEKGVLLSLEMVPKL